MCMSPRQSCSGVMGIQVIDIGRQQLTSVRGDPDVGSSGQPGQGRDRGARWSRVSSALQSWLPARAAVVPSSLALCRGARRHMLCILLYPLFFPLHSCAVSGPGSHAHGATAPRAQPPEVLRKAGVCPRPRPPEPASVCPQGRAFPPGAWTPQPCWRALTSGARRLCGLCSLVPVPSRSPPGLRPHVLRFAWSLLCRVLGSISSRRLVSRVWLCSPVPACRSHGPGRRWRPRPC